MEQSSLCFLALHSWVRSIPICGIAVESLRNVNQIFRNICNARFHEYCMQTSFEIRGWKFCKTSVKGCDEYSCHSFHHLLNAALFCSWPGDPLLQHFLYDTILFFSHVIIHGEYSECGERRTQERIKPKKWVAIAPMY